MSTRPVHGSSLLLLLVLGSACGGASPSSPIAPAKTISATAAGYLNAAVDIMAAHSLNRKSIDWSAVRQAVLQKAGAAQTIPDTYDAIVVGLGLLNDRHSFFEKPDGTTVTNPQAPTCADAPIVPPDPSALGTVRYIAVGTCQSPACSAAEYAQSLQARIAANDGPDVSGWIVDLRHNAGGNLWAMIGGVGPILGNGRLGDFVDADGNRTTFGYQDGTALYGSTAVLVISSPYYLSSHRAPRVAVLTDGATSGSGEIVAIAFRGAPSTRSFGNTSCGIPTGVTGYPLSDRATMYVTTVTMADRNGTVYGSVIVPDELIADPRQALTRAVDWLQGR